MRRSWSLLRRSMKAAGVAAILAILAGCALGSNKRVEEKVQTVRIDLSDYRFSPNVIKTDVGTLLEVTLTNSALQTHELVLHTPEGEYELEVEPGGAVQFGVKFRKPGNFAITCDLEGHHAQGMRGVIQVAGEGPRVTFPGRPDQEGEERVNRVEMALADFRFSPSETTAARGTLLEFHLSNSAVQTHELVLDGKSVEFEVEVESGRSVTFGVKYHLPGLYPFTCDLPGHREQGMAGEIAIR